MNSITFDNKALRRGLGVFKKAKVSSRDLIGKAMLLHPYDGVVHLHVTDGASYTEVRVPAIVRGDWEPLVVHAKALPLAALACPGEIVLTETPQGFYTYFETGNLYVPTFNINHAIFVKPDLVKPCKTWELPADHLKYIFESLLPILNSPNQTPGLAFFLFSPHGVFCSNGSMICKLAFDYPHFVIRKKDVPTIQLLLNATTDTLALHKFHDCYQVSDGDIRYTFPEVEQDLSNDWKSSPGSLQSHFYVDVVRASHIIGILDKMPDSSGTAILEFSQTDLRVIGKTRKGDESRFLLSSDTEGIPRIGVYPVSTRTLLTALAVFGQDGSCMMGISDRGLLQMFVRDKYLTVLLKAA